MSKADHVAVQRPEVRASGGSHLASVALMAASLVVALGAGEVIVRFVVPAPLPYAVPQVRYQPHAVRRFTLRPDQTAYTYGAAVHIGALGFRSNGPSGGKEDSALVVLALGDSFTFGLGVADSDTWPAQLEQLLRGRVPGPVRVVNAGTVSYGVFQEMNLLRERGLALQPEVIIHALYWNDYMTAGPPPPGAPPVLTPDGAFVWDAQAAKIGVPRSLGRAILRGSRLAAGAWRLAHNRSDAYARRYDSLMHGKINERDWEPIRMFYRDLRRIADSTGAAVYVIVMPVSGLVASRREAASRYREFMSRLLAEEGMPFVDGNALLANRARVGRWFLPQGPDSHLNAEGYRLMARQLADAMVRDSTIQRYLRFPGRQDT